MELKSANFFFWQKIFDFSPRTLASLLSTYLAPELGVISPTHETLQLRYVSYQIDIALQGWIKKLPQVSVESLDRLCSEV
jgi:hypothetical protein